MSAKSKGSGNKSNRNWIHNHLNDPYVKQAQIDGYRSRAAYKLIEMNEKERLFKPGMLVIDLGSAPGSWSQVVRKLINPNGRIIALDILPMETIPGVEFIQGDFTEDAVMEQLLTSISTQKADVIISDMAPNLSGYDSVDIPKGIYLCELALDIALKVLKPDGCFITKLFQGAGFDAFLLEIKKIFKHVSIKKPKASRDKSREVYIFAKTLRERAGD